MKAYFGLPLSVFTFDGESWGGRSNFDTSPGYSSQTITSLQDAINWIKKWDDTTWEIYDGETNTLYISNDNHEEKSVKHVESNYEVKIANIVVGFPQI